MDTTDISTQLMKNSFRYKVNDTPEDIEDYFP